MLFYSTRQDWLGNVMTAGGLVIIYLFPYINKTIPSPLVCIVGLTALFIFFDLPIRTVDDMGKLPDTLPVLLWPQISSIQIAH